MARFKWPVPDDETLIRELSESDDECRPYRLERYKFLWEEFGPPADMLLIGGIPSMFAIEEIKRSFIYSNFMATILLAQTFVEHSLGGSYRLSGRDPIVEQGFKKLIERALADGHISAELAAKLHELRNMRNPYVHPNAGLTSRSYMGRLAEKKVYDPETLLEQDARYAVQIVVDYLRHGSPNWNPGKYVYKRS